MSKYSVFSSAGLSLLLYGLSIALYRDMKFSLLVFSVLFCLQAGTARTVSSPKVFAIIKASYKNIGSKDIRGGISGTAFFISPKVALTAAHVVNKKIFVPHKGYLGAKVWLANNQFGTKEVQIEMVRAIPELDLTVIAFKKPVVSSRYIFSLANSKPRGFANVSSVGYAGVGTRPTLAWRGRQLVIDRLSQLPFHRESGSIRQIPRVNVKAADMQLKNVLALRLSYGSYVGMSGGPTLQNGKVIGVNSFGFPADQQKKTDAWSIFLAKEYKEQLFKNL